MLYGEAISLGKSPYRGIGAPTPTLPSCLLYRALPLGYVTWLQVQKPQAKCQPLKLQTETNFFPVDLRLRHLVTDAAGHSQSLFVQMPRGTLNGDGRP